MSSEGASSRYLRLLGLDRADPTLDLLTRLVSAQLTRVPFENVSKLWRNRERGATGIPSSDEYLDGIEHMGFGGTCYATNGHFNSLLTDLGFDVTLCGADMGNPDVHVVSIVRLGDREYLVDVGYAAPFMTPLPRDVDRDHIVGLGRLRWILRPRDDAGCSRLDLVRDGSRIHGYIAKPVPRTMDHFAEVIRDSYRPDATFMNTVVAERFSRMGSTRIHNLTLTRTPFSGRATARTLRDVDDLVAALERYFGIPPAIARRAVSGVRLDGDIYA